MLTHSKQLYPLNPTWYLFTLSPLIILSVIFKSVDQISVSLHCAFLKLLCIPASLPKYSSDEGCLETLYKTSSPGSQCVHQQYNRIHQLIQIYCKAGIRVWKQAVGITYFKRRENPFLPNRGKNKNNLRTSPKGGPIQHQFSQGSARHVVCGLIFYSDSKVPIQVPMNKTCRIYLFSMDNKFCS